MRRRTFLAAAAAVPVLAACGSDLFGTVRVGVTWSGAELAQFRRELRHFTASRRWGVSVVSLGDDVETLLAGRVARAVTPDVVMLPRPGLLAADTGGLVELPATLAPQGVSPRWQDLAAGRGVWYKVAHKSLVWYRPDVFAELGVEPPTDWAGWRHVQDVCRAHRLPPLSIGAADGWVLTDWFENVLWGLDPTTTYDLLARGEDVWASDFVATALGKLAELWAPAGTFPGGAARALVTQFEDSVLDVALRGKAAMVVGADFALPVVTRLAPDAPPLDWFPMPPPPDKGVRPLIVGGDLAVLLAGAGPGGLELIDWLATADAARDWARFGGFVSLRDDVTDYPAPYRKKVGPDNLDLVQQVRLGGPNGFGFDLSDQLAGPLAGSAGLFRVLQRFLAELGQGRTADLAVRDTVAALRAAAGSRR